MTIHENDHLLPLHPSAWPRARGYANGIRVKAGCDMVYIAGQIGWDKDGRFPGNGDIVAQFGQALDNFLAVVAEGSGAPTDVVSMTFYVTDIERYINSRAEIGKAWKQRFGRHYPTMALVQVTALVEKSALVEVQGIAAVRNDSV